MNPVRLFDVAASCCWAARIFAADPFYLGTWKIDSARVAPWWSSPGTPFPKCRSSLSAKPLSSKASSIAGPGLLACDGPKYKVSDFPADWLFQGAFGEMRDKDKSVDPEKLAADLGFHGTQWKTLETGCANEIDFHFVDDNTAEFGLDNYVFRMKRQ